MTTKLTIAANISWFISGLLLGLTVACFLAPDETTKIRLLMWSMWLLCLELCDVLWAVRVVKYDGD